MKEGDNEEIKLRLSNASTIDNEFSGDDENEKKECIASSFSPMDALHLLEIMPDDVLLKYTDLESKLNSIYTILEEEITPTCIREEKCLLATSVNLTAVRSSNLFLRRARFSFPTLECKSAP